MNFRHEKELLNKSLIMTWFEWEYEICVLCD